MNKAEFQSAYWQAANRKKSQNLRFVFTANFQA